MFTAKTLDFLTENCMRDDKVWFRENKPVFQEYVSAPMKEFSDTLYTYIEKLDSSLDKVHISRIYRDTRFLHGRSFFRENMWVSFGRTKELYESLPAFYFDISPNGIEYGCGFYQAKAEHMMNMRELILAGSPLFYSAAEAVENTDFELYGDKYKKSRCPVDDDIKRDWYDRKTIGIFTHSENWDMIFSDELPHIIGRQLTEAAPVYRFLMAATHTVR